MQRVIKANVSQKTVTFVALVPDEVDANDSVISADEIAKTAHDFMMNLQYKTVNVNHTDWTDIPKEDATFVESYILPVEMTVWDDVIPKGTRMIWIKFNNDEMFQQVIDGEFVGISIEWYQYV